MADPLVVLYPERRIAGLYRTDQRVSFFVQVNSLLKADMRVLDFGAGRGKWTEVETGFKLALTTLKGKCREVVGTDPDEVVLQNTLVDRAVHTPLDQRLPFDDESFDLIVSWAVFEHIENPEFTAAELTRVLKPGGWICAWTPNKWSYYALAARLLPKRLHNSLLKVTSFRKEEDVFPTAYRLNTMSAIRHYFQGFEHFSYYDNGPPFYHCGRLSLALIWQLWGWLMPKKFAQTIHVFLRKVG